jgi:hypothetical protein
MNNAEFYSIVRTEATTLNFLRTQRLLPDGNQGAPVCGKQGCPGIMRLTIRRSTLVDGTIRTRESFKCPKKGCQTTRSIRNDNSFFTITSMTGRSNSHLAIAKILEIVFLWCSDQSCKAIIAATGLSSNTVIRWMDKCRDVPHRMWKKRKQMAGKGKKVQGDESLLRGKRKANKGRLLAGDRKRRRDEEEDDEDEGDEDLELIEPPDDEPEFEGDYGDRVHGSLV